MGALDGIRVIDFARILAGPWATQLLADLGAEVLKIERPGQGDDTRNWGPPFLEAQDGAPLSDAAYFCCTNRNKKSVAIDITTPSGQELVRKLVAQADVVVENFKVGGLAKYGLDYASLKIVTFPQGITDPHFVVNAHRKRIAGVVPLKGHCAVRFRANIRAANIMR